MRTGDKVVTVGAAQAAELFLSHVSARAIEAVCLLMVASLDLETLMQNILCRCFIGTRNRFLRDANANE